MDILKVSIKHVFNVHMNAKSVYGRVRNQRLSANHARNNIHCLMTIVPNAIQDVEN